MKKEKESRVQRIKKELKKSQPEKWKQVKPSWCRHSTSCKFLMHSPDIICSGKFFIPSPHNEDFNTNRLCFWLNPNDIIDIQINKGDVYNLMRVLKNMF